MELNYNVFDSKIEYHEFKDAGVYNVALYYISCEEDITIINSYLYNPQHSFYKTSYYGAYDGAGWYIFKWDCEYVEVCYCKLEDYYASIHEQLVAYKNTLNEMLREKDRERMIT